MFDLLRGPTLDPVSDLVLDFLPNRALALDLVTIGFVLDMALGRVLCLCTGFCTRSWILLYAYKRTKMAHGSFTVHGAVICPK